MKDYKNRGNGVRERKGTAEARAQLSAAFHVAQDQVTPECHREAAWFPEVGHGRDGVNTPHTHNTCEQYSAPIEIQCVSKCFSTMSQS